MKERKEGNKKGRKPIKILKNESKNQEKYRKEHVC